MTAPALRTEERASTVTRPEADRGVEVIDAHHHAIPARVLALFARDDVYRVTVDGDRWHGGNHVDFRITPDFVETEHKLARLDALGIDRAIVSAIPPLFYYELDPRPAQTLATEANAGLAEMAAESGGRLWWIGHVPLQDTATAVEMVGDIAAAGGVGLHIGSQIACRRLDEPEFDDFWAACAAAALPVTIHPDFTYERHPALADWYLNNVVGLPLETTLTAARLICAGVLDRHPDLRIALLHGGGFLPYQAGRLKHARSVRPELRDAPADPWQCFGQLVIDSITHDPQALAYLVERVGAENVVFGTDLPFDMAPHDPVAGVRAGIADPDVAAAVLSGNARRIYRLGHAAAATRPQADGGALRP